MIPREVYGKKEIGSRNSQITQLVRSIAYFFFQFYIYECSMQLLFLELVIFLYLLIDLVLYTLRQSARSSEPTMIYF